MKKIKVLTIAALIGAGSIQANPVSPSTAKTVATNYYGQVYSSPSQTLTLAYTEKDKSGAPVFYVFNVAGNNGFVIVSAEDAGIPIIGVSNTGHYVIPSSSNNVSYWMNKRKNEIISIRTNKMVATPEIASEWNSYITNTAKNTRSVAATSVAPLCKTTWDQSPFYNAMCPGKGTGQSVTGCVATAMAQIMKFWAYPSVGLGSNCYYDEISSGYSANWGELCATFDTSHYVWSAMPNIVGSFEYKECAKLMYDCGVSVDMDYDSTGSGAEVIGGAPSAQNSYVQYFNYDPSTINGVLQFMYSNSAWVTLIENELTNGRPVQYMGTDPSEGGHSWVCDGFNTSNQLHMNWGWSGYDDGYFVSTSLTPTGFDFSQDIGAIIGIEPPPGALAVQQVINNESFKVYPNPSNGMFNLELTNITGNPQISVYNVLGQNVYSAKLTSIQSNMNLGNQAKGVYIYRVVNETGKQISTGRLVIE